MSAVAKVISADTSGSIIPWNMRSTMNACYLKPGQHVVFIRGLHGSKSLDIQRPASVTIVSGRSTNECLFRFGD
jgi:hypothetical protein